MHIFKLFGQRTWWRNWSILLADLLGDNKKSSLFSYFCEDSFQSLKVFWGAWSHPLALVSVFSRVSETLKGLEASRKRFWAKFVTPDWCPSGTRRACSLTLGTGTRRTTRYLFHGGRIPRSKAPRREHVPSPAKWFPLSSAGRICVSLYHRPCQACILWVIYGVFRAVG